MEETKKNERQKWTAGLTKGKWRAEDGGCDGGEGEVGVRWTDEEEES